jgi:two-component system, OmpR family, sensor histidine kinase VicK
MSTEKTKAEKDILHTYEEGTKYERTEMFTGPEVTTKRICEFFSNVYKKFDVCANSAAPSIAMTIFRDDYEHMKSRGIKIRWVTDITKDNLTHCKDLMQQYAEVRHISSLNGNFGVSEREYIAAATIKEGQPLPKLIYSNSKEMVEQQQYIFDSFWGKAIPADQRIKEIEEGITTEKTVVTYGLQQVTSTVFQCFERANDICECSDSSALTALRYEPYRKLWSDFKEKGGRAKFITEITKSNLAECKVLMQYATEIRHLDNVKGNFAITDRGEYLASSTVNQGEQVDQLIYSNAKQVVAQHQYLFLTLWEKAVPAEHRIREIEQGVEPQRIAVIYDARQALELYQSLIMSAEKEIKIVFPTTNALIRQDKAGILFLLREAAAAAKKCQVKILMPNDESIHHFIQNDNSSGGSGGGGGISTRFIDQEESGKATILIIDNKVSLVMELKDDSKKTFHEAIGLSTYSNSKAGVLSYVSMFESLWKQTELYEVLKSNEKMQREFINIAAHELRTPVQPILGMAELIELSFKDGKHKAEISKDEIDMILRNARRLERLSSDVLETARIESQSLRLNKEAFSMKDVISSSIRDAENQINGAHISIRYEPIDIPVYADKGRIAEVICNMLDNAIKFTHEGKITISTEASNDEAIVLIKDEGKGIDREIMSKLFVKFATKSDKGTGLGLYISKSIVEAHGGKIWAKNNEDQKGATFGFALPFEQD